MGAMGNTVVFDGAIVMDATQSRQDEELKEVAAKADLR